MTKGQYPTITRGMGNLTPQLWERMMAMLRIFEKNNRDETGRRSRGGGGTATLFLAKITKAKCIQPNIYKYAWEQVRLVEDYLTTSPLIGTFTGNKTSTVDADEYAFAALNVMELQNTSTRASAGVNMGADQYPSGYSLQAIGGGSCTGTGCEITPDIEAVVMMWRIGGASTELNEVVYLFSAVNDHDGTCGADMLTIDDPIDSDPSATTAKAHIYVDDSDGDLRVVFANGQVRTIVTDEPP